MPERKRHSSPAGRGRVPEDVSSVIPSPSSFASSSLLSELRELIESARSAVAATVNAGLTMLYWRVGDRIRREILKEKRAEYGEEIVATVSRHLEAEFGRGFGRRNLFRMVHFAEVFPDSKIVSALRTQLGWTHFRQIITLDDPLKRDFYAEMCRMERWSTRTLQNRIDSMLYERTALSNGFALTPGPRRAIIAKAPQ